MKSGWIVFVVLVGALGASAGAWAKDEKVGAELGKVETAVSTQKEKAADLEGKEKEAAAQLQKLQDQLVAATDDWRSKQKEADTLSDKVDDLALEEKEKATTLSLSRENLSALTSALLQLGREPPEAFLLHDTLTKDDMHRGVLLRGLLPRVQLGAEKMAKDLEALAAVREKTKAQRQLVSQAEKNLGIQRESLNALIKTRQGLLLRTAKERESLVKEIEKLTAEAKDLRDLMKQVSQVSVMPKEKALKTPALKKGLKMPVVGKLVRNYGSRDAYGVVSDGLTLSANTGSPVVAPFAGKVVFAGPFKGYGQIVILAHGNGTHSFLAGFGKIDAEVGQDVVAGEPLGALPDKATGEKAEIYFEWRKNGDPIDPTNAG